MTNFPIPGHIAGVLHRLTGNGFEAYLVGGGVRDTLMSRCVHDWDIASAAAVHDVARLFDKTVMTGARFGTVTVILPECSVEITTFRTDGEYTDGRRPENVTFTGTLETDLKRRDFTMNAIAVSEHGLIIDPLCGMRDIENRVIRCVGDPEKRFCEDALRMFRAMRFSAQLGFSIERETLSAIYKLAPEAGRLSAQRVRIETERTLMSQKPEILSDMINAGLFAGRAENVKIASDKFSKIKKLPPDSLLRWCAFCAILKNAGIIDCVSRFAVEKLRLDRKTVKCCVIGTKTALSGFPRDKPGIKRLISAHGEQTVRCAAAGYDVLHADDALERTDAVLNSGECFSICGLCVTGRDLTGAGFGILPGKRLGEILNALLEHVIMNPGDNNRETLLRLARDFFDKGL